jgi:hypothetical protein
VLDLPGATGRPGPLVPELPADRIVRGHFCGADESTLSSALRTMDAVAG